MSIVNSITSEADILATVVAPNQHRLPPELARLFLDSHFTDEQVARMHELADKNNAGTITPEERQLMENYARVGSFLSQMQSKGAIVAQFKR